MENQKVHLLMCVKYIY